MITKSAIEDFVEALAGRDADRLGSVLDPDVRLRAVLPSGAQEWRGAEACMAEFDRWFAPEAVVEIEALGRERFCSRMHVMWRFRVRTVRDGGERCHLLEQHAFIDGDDHLTSIDLVCSGYLRV